MVKTKYIVNEENINLTLHKFNKELNDDYSLTNCGIKIWTIKPYDKNDINVYKFPLCHRCFRSGVRD